jgi:hypothetical protein
MGLVGIGVFATVSSFGDGTTSQISRGILPVIGGALPSPNEMSPSNPQSGQFDAPQSADFGGETGEQGSVGGTAGDGGGGDTENGGDDNSFVGGTDAMPPVYDGGADSSDSRSWSSENSNSFVGGLDAYPETGYQGGGRSEGSNTSAGSEGSNVSAGAEVPTDY